MKFLCKSEMIKSKLKTKYNKTNFLYGAKIAIFGIFSK